MTYEHTRLDAPALRALAATTAVRIFPPPAPRQWWRAVFAPPPPQHQQFRHLYERFTEGEYVLNPFFKVKEGPSLRLRSDGIIERVRCKVEQDRLTSYSDPHEATDEDLLLADYHWEPE